MKKINIRQLWVPLSVAAVLFLLYYYGNANGIRYCNCTPTDSWKPGEQRGVKSSGGRSHFYHK